MIAMPRGPALIAIGVSAYMIFLVATFPAHLAARWFLPDGVQATGVKGTIWSGQADAVAASATILGRTKWDARPLLLFVARLSADVETRISDGALQGRIAIRPGGTMTLHDVAGVVPLSMLSAIVPTAMLDGRIGLDLDSATLKDNWIIDAKGTVDLVNLTITSPVVEALGSYEIAFNGAGDDTLVGDVTNIDGPLEAQGKLLLHKDRRWNLEGNLTPSAATSSQLSQALGMLGQRDGQGRYNLSFSGEL